MTNFSCKLGDEIHLGDEITLVVLAISKNRVKLGIRGPREVPVRRGELSHYVPLLNRGEAELALHGFSHQQN